MANYRAGAAGSMYDSDVYAPEKIEPICICATHAEAERVAALLNTLRADRDAAVAQVERLQRVGKAATAYNGGWLSCLLCRIGWHQGIGATVGGFIRCYTCGLNLHPQDGIWRREFPPELRPAGVVAAEPLRMALEDLALACWNDDKQPQPEWDMAMQALGYRRDGDEWRRP